MKPRDLFFLGFFAALPCAMLAAARTAASALPASRPISGTKKSLQSAFHIDQLLKGGSAAQPCRALKAFSGKSVLVSGAGGSIGSELCRQVAAARPARLILLDCCENGVYALEQELRARHRGPFSLAVEIGSVQDEKRLDQIFSRHHPQVVFHAAAHKHVPMMEACPGEAIKNNIFGTQAIAQAAIRHQAERFVLISTDKAVNPSSVMGATKRFCEMLLQSMQRQCKTEFAIVRFGNVLGSNGSVVPLFLRQIEQGGPVTVTDRRMIRYFMTIPEAVGLVLRAGAMQGGTGTYVLDMGQPIRILTLAERLITLAGHLPYQDIRIVETGLRPGEKLREELLSRTHRLQKTADRNILVERPQIFSPTQINRALADLHGAVQSGSSVQLRQALLRAVPSYHPLSAQGKNPPRRTRKR